VLFFLYLKLIPIESSEGEDVKERTVRLSGNKQQVEAAKYMIRDVINQVLISRNCYFGWRDMCKLEYAQSIFFHGKESSDRFWK
jgi:hypothetical protein